jgi:hypothetical protein
MENEELWIDLGTLITCSTYENDFLNIWFRYDKENPKPEYDTIDYSLRCALRALGFKITKRTTTFAPGYGLEVICVEYQTNIHRHHDKWIQKYNNWLDSVAEEVYQDIDTPCSLCEADKIDEGNQSLDKSVKDVIH